MIYYLSLGSNLGTRLVHLRQTLNSLESMGTLLNKSSIYETSPVGGPSKSGNFYNMVVCLSSHLSAWTLLANTKTLEANMGRNSTQGHNQPRIIDIDILLAEESIINSPHLTIPHREMGKRAFVLVPLNEIAPDVIHPTCNLTIHQLLKALKNDEIVKKIIPSEGIFLTKENKNDRHTK